MGMRAYYLCVNRNKSGMVVNFKTDEGKAILRNLAMQSDVLAEMQHPTIGVLPLVGSPLKMGVTPVQYHLPPPLMG
jgi:crotonobetainyl-CoA:carnitine CoA-transferase CaiB-like acyl-CoA transferase